MTHDDAFLRAVGAELRAAREAHRWTRAALITRSGLGIAESTLAGYESGHSAIPLTRLLRLCHTLRTPMPELLDRALRRQDADEASLLLDLRAVLDTGNHLAPLRAWARIRLHADPDRTRIHLNPAAVSSLARLCGLTTHRLHHLLDHHDATEPPDDVWNGQ